MRRLLIIALCLLALSLDAQAPPSFREGVIAFEKGEWAKAETAMRAAVAANPKETEGTVSIAGSWFETYVPHYFLARALAKQGKCDEALKEFAESERQGVTPTISDFARHLQTRGGCKPQAKAAKPPRVVTEVTVPFAEEETTTRAPEVVKPAANPVIKPPVKPAVKFASVPPVTPALPPAQSTIDLRARAERALLSAAVTEYLRGRYAEGARLLESAQFSDRALAAEAALFRAASKHALYRIGGEKDETLKRDLEHDLDRYRALRGNAPPDPRVFPPSFIALAR
jgi:tetratricopeptide (TPR) repeat protein